MSEYFTNIVNILALLHVQKQSCCAGFWTWALDRNRELKSHNIILLFFERFDQCMEVSERAIILSSLYNQFRDFLIRQPITIYGNFTSHKTMDSLKQCLVFKYHRYSIKDTKCEWSSLAYDILDHIPAFADWMAACQRGPASISLSSSSPSQR